MDNYAEKKICVLGLGYIGLPTASMFATNGFEVLGVDVCADLVERLNSGGIHIEEPGLSTLFEAAVHSGRLRAATEPAAADVYVIAVPTPANERHEPDLSFVRKAAESIVPHLRRGNLVILESTSPPGTTRDLVAPILEGSGLKAGEVFFLAHSPERVLPGRILRELIENDRIIGGIDERSAEMARDLYASFVEGEILLTDCSTAEMAKLMENTYRDVNIALANELGRICEDAGVSAWEAIALANRHPRVNLHSPGPGVGGHCIAVDPWFIAQAAPDKSALIRLARRINDEQPGIVLQRIRLLIDNLADELQSAPRVAVLGLTYKANVDDVRESPAVKIALGLEEIAEEANFDLRICDPRLDAWEGASALASIDEALSGADLLVLLTGHDEFKALAPQNLKKQMRSAIIYDSQNILDGKRWREMGFAYHALGARR